MQLIASYPMISPKVDKSQGKIFLNAAGAILLLINDF
jgi:hypothetical protein